MHGPTFSIDKLDRNLYLSLNDSTVGWAYTIWKKGKPVFEKQGGYKITPRDTKTKNGFPFLTSTRVHIASMSKTITALTVAKMVELKIMNWNDKVQLYLPTWWKIHPLFEQLTIGNLVAMKSGLNAPLDMVSSSTDSLRILMERGPDTTKMGIFNYQNTSYGLLRIVIAYAEGYKELSPDADSKSMSVATAIIYKNAVNKYIFSPAGVDSADCRINEPYPAFQYPFPYHNEPGELTGDPELTQFAGAFGWYMSAKEVAEVLNSVFYKKNIISLTTLQDLASLSFPINVRSGKYGDYFGSGGDWGHPVEPQGWRGIHSYYYCYPDDDTMVVVFVNSGNSSPSGKMMRAYLNSFE